jgi:type III secretion protein T
MTPTNLDTVLLEGWFTSATLALPRLLTIFATVPFFSGQMVSGGVRAGLVAILVIFVSPVVDDVQSLSLGLWVLIAAKESLIGLMLGLGFGVFVWALQSVGDFIDFQTGSGNAAFFDPVAGHENGPTGQFLGWLAITLFISAGGLLAMLGVIVDSYLLWPVTSFFPEPGGLLEEFAIRQGDTLFTWIVKLAAPVLFVLLLVELGIGLVGRTAPQLNVFIVTQPVKSLLATLMMILLLHYVYESLQVFLQPDNVVLKFLRDSLR